MCFKFLSFIYKQQCVYTFAYTLDTTYKVYGIRYVSLALSFRMYYVRYSMPKLFLPEVKQVYDQTSCISKCSGYGDVQLKTPVKFDNQTSIM